jgi:hypothetical protein
MPSNFSSLRSSRKTLLDKLAAEVKKEQAKGGSNDERFWKLTVDAKTKIGYAKLRFLPAPKDEDIPWARVFSHAFTGPSGSWFIENCLTTLARPCPVCKDNTKLWNSGVEAEKEVVRKRKRKLQFISNVLIIEDSAHPENNGKVFLFKYGAKIHAKIMELIEPEFPDQTPANPFDFWGGCDFKLKSQAVAGYQNYDKSSFDAPSELFADDDDKKEEIWAAEKSLLEFTAEGQFKNYEELADRFAKVVSGDDGDAPRTAAEAVAKSQPTLEDAQEAAVEVEKRERKLPPKSKPVAKKAEPVEKSELDPAPAGDDDADIRAFFADMKDD